MDIALYIAETLETTPKVAVKGLGTFTLTSMPSVIDEETQTIIPPRKIYSMEIDVEEAAISPLVQHINRQRNISEPSCIWFITNWVEKLQSELSEKNFAERKPLGVFSRLNGNVIILAEQRLPEEGTGKEGSSWLGKLSLGKSETTKASNEEAVSAPLKDKKGFWGLFGSKKAKDKAVVPVEKDAVEEPKPTPAPEVKKVEEPIKVEKPKEEPIAEVPEPTPIVEEKKTEPVAEPEKPKAKAKEKVKKTAKTSMKVEAAEGALGAEKKKRKPVAAITAIIIVVAGLGAGYYFFQDKLNTLLNGDGTELSQEENADSTATAIDSTVVAGVEPETEAKINAVREQPTKEQPSPKAKEPVKKVSVPVVVEEKDAPEPKKKVEPKKAPESPLAGLSMDTKYQIIVGSYPSEAEARKMQQKLENLKLDVTFYIIEANGHYRISIGGYDDYEQTKAKISYCKRRIAPDCWVYKQ